MKHEYTYPCTLNTDNKHLGAYDGDTVYLTLDRGFGDTKHVSARLDGIDTAEIRGGTELTKKLAHEARIRLLDICNSANNLVFHSTLFAGKFGRPIGKLYADELDVGQILLDEGLAIPYEGGTSREGFTERHHELAMKRYNMRG